MTRDVTTVVLRSRQMVALWVAFVVVVAAGLVVLLGGGADADVVLLVLVAFPVLAVVLVLSTRRAARRTLTVAFPPGTEVSLAVTDDGLQQRSALGSSQTAWSAFRDVRVRGAAVVLRLRGSSAFVVLPSALLTQSDHEVIRARLG